MLINQDFDRMLRDKADRMTTVRPDLTSKLLPLICRTKDNEARKLQQIMCGTKQSQWELILQQSY